MNINKKMEAYLNELNKNELFYLYREANFYDGSFDFSNIYDIEEIVKIMQPTKLVNAIIYGNVTNTSDLVRFDGDGHLETITDDDLFMECQDCINELSDYIIENIQVFKDNLLYQDLLYIIEEAEFEEEEEE